MIKFMSVVMDWGLIIWHYSLQDRDHLYMVCLFRSNITSFDSSVGL